MALHNLSWLLPLLLLLLLFGKIDTKVPAVIVFGDSTVDTGNNNEIHTLTKSNFPPYGRDFEGGKPTGRFCDGRLATDFVSEAFGIKPIIPAYLDPTYSIKDFATGVCFASAGTGYDNATAHIVSVLPLWQELEYFKDYQMKLRSYLGTNMANNILSEALYMLSIGTNDFLQNYFTVPGRSSQYTVKEYENFLIGIADNFITELYRLGARKISIAGLPPMGCLPLERTLNFRKCRQVYNMLAKDFNSKLETLRDNLTRKLQGSRLVVSNFYDTMLLAIERPHLLGFEVVEKGCCGTGRIETSYLCNPTAPFTCKDASKYVFWDSFHGTEKMNHIIANHLIKTDLAEFF